jgi:hypothetical protein
VEKHLHQDFILGQVIFDSRTDTISGSPTDVWIFQVAGNLDMSATVRITLAEVLKPKISLANPVQLH